ncbi:MAG: hypothetical protein JEZ11_25825 [Desulfobacterales bacterium]|nr:hypothetical protein [Desulfobacterales bacterium]
MNAKILLTLFLCLLMPCSAGAGEVVTAKGMSFFEPGRELIARDKALDAAKREAVEMAVGVSVESRTVVENFQVNRDQVLSHASGYLKNVKILDEKKSDLGTYTVTIEAEVEIPALVGDLDRFKKILGWQKNPKIRLVIEPGVAAEHLSAARKSLDRLAGKLRTDGFRVFKDTAADSAMMGLQVGLGLEMASSESDYQGVRIKLNEVSLSANIYRPSDGEVLATAGAVKSLPGANRLAALDKGAGQCLDEMWRDLRRQLTRTWEKEFYSQRTIDLVITNVPSQARALEIASILKSDVSSMADASVVRFDKTRAEYSLQYKGWTEQLITELQMSYFSERYFVSELEKISGNQLVISIRQ